MCRYETEFQAYDVLSLFVPLFLGALLDQGHCPELVVETRSLAVEVVVLLSVQMLVQAVESLELGSLIAKVVSLFLMARGEPSEVLWRVLQLHVLRLLSGGWALVGLWILRNLDRSSWLSDYMTAHGTYSLAVCRISFLTHSSSCSETLIGFSHIEIVLWNRSSSGVSAFLSIDFLIASSSFGNYDQAIDYLIVF